MIYFWSIIGLAGLVVVLCPALVLIHFYCRHTKPLVYKTCPGFIKKPQLGPYYVSVKRKLADYYPLDGQGGLLARHAPTGEWYYDPLTNAHRALGHYEVFVQTSDPRSRQEFLRWANNLKAHGRLREDGAMVWEYHIRDYAGQKTPWLHAMAQGQVIMVMCRAFQETQEQEFLNLALAASRPFLLDVSEGGVRSTDPYRGVFYEEYAYHEENKQHHTLNGMMSALMGLHDLWKVSREPWVRKLFDEGTQTIRRNLTAYDFPFCSSYDLRHEHGQPLPYFQSRYNSVHVTHLRILAAMTDDPFFALVAERWNQKLRDPFNRLCLTAWYPRFKLQDLRKEIRLTGSLSKVVANNLFRLGKRLTR